MADGIARTVAAVVRGACFAAGAIALLSSGVQGQTTLEAPPLSTGCRAPPTDIATPEPLPHLAKLLSERSVVRVLAIGSSSTAGVGASSPSHSYTAQLEQILERAFKGVDVVIINRGVSGEAAALTSSRLRNEVALNKPDLVLWQVGTNDALARVPVEEFAGTVRETLGWLKEHGIDTVLVGLQYGHKVVSDEHYAAIRQALREVADSENVLLVRRWEAMRFIEKATAATLLNGDDLHLNDLGYQCMAEHIAQALVVSAFLRRSAPSPKP